MVFGRVMNCSGIVNFIFRIYSVTCTAHKNTYGLLTVNWILYGKISIQNDFRKKFENIIWDKNETTSKKNYKNFLRLGRR